MNSLLICIFLLFFGYFIDVVFFRKRYILMMKNRYSSHYDYTGPIKRVWIKFFQHCIEFSGPPLMLIFGFYHIDLFIVIVLAIIINFLEFAVWDDRLEYTTSVKKRLLNVFYGFVSHILFYGIGFTIYYFTNSSNMLIPLMIILIIETINRKTSKVPYY